MNGKVFKATLLTLLTMLVTLAVVGLGWYAATHPFFAIYVLCPTLVIAMVVMLWFFFYECIVRD
jgi:hypothetical protein